MEKKQFHRRGLGMLLLLAVILFGLGSSLYDAQMIHGAEYLARSQNSIAETQTVEAVFTDPSGMNRYAVVEPDVDLDSLVEVFVIKSFDIVE